MQVLAIKEGREDRLYHKPMFIVVKKELASITPLKLEISFSLSTSDDYSNTLKI